MMNNRQDWISVKERMPEEKQHSCNGVKGAPHSKLYLVVVKDPFGKSTSVQTDMTINGKWYNYGCDITHWMPLPDAPEEYNKTIVFSKKKWMECKFPEDIREDALQSGWVDECDGKPVEKGMCGRFLIVDTWCVDADEWEAYEDE